MNKRPVPVTCLLLAALAGAPLGALAQIPTGSRVPVVRDDPAQYDRKTQRVERIQLEDSGSRVEELRAGGETRAISVQPKTGLPAYEVEPTDTTGAGAFSREAAPGATGKRVWKVLKF